MSTVLDRIRRWFGEKTESPVATPPPGAAEEGTSDVERETSTNAQTEGAADEPWPGNT
jgi:hypothetical protein